MTTRHTTRAITLLVSLLLSTVGLTVAGAPAHAATIGSLFVSPNPGDQDTFMRFDTAGPCPQGTQAVTARLTGPGITDDGENNLTGNTEYDVLQPNSSGGKTVAAAATLKSIFQKYALPQSTNYQIIVRCQTTDGTTVFGEFVGTIALTVSTGFSFTYTQASEAVVTSTVISADPGDPVKAGTSSTLTATVSPSGVPGMLQFKRNGANFGGAVRVAGGTAQFSAALPSGVSSLTATFTPDDANSYRPSTSDRLDYLVVAAPVVTGTPQVGKALTCNLGTDAGTNAIAWLVAGRVEPGQTGRTVTVPPAWAGKKVACQVTTSRSGRSVTQSSNEVTVAAATIRNTNAPVVVGTARVGRTLTCSPGSWSPKPTSIAYQWLRDGRTIRAASRASYKVVRADRRHGLSCRVTASATGAGRATATSKAKAVA